jgi:hypothetical protein
MISSNYASSIVPDITGTQRPPIKVAVTTPFCFSAFACRILVRPISTPCAIVFDSDRFGSGRSFANSPISATLALPVAGSSGMFK